MLGVLPVPGKHSLHSIKVKREMSSFEFDCWYEFCMRMFMGSVKKRSGWVFYVANARSVNQVEF